MAHPYQKFAQAVADAGINGQSMQDKLAELIRDNDLNQNEVRRICEDANRTVHLHFVKAAQTNGTDPRVRFDLVDPAVGTKTARKTAEASLYRTATQLDTLTSVMDSDGDAFRTPDELKVASPSLSLYETDISPSLTKDQEEQESRELLYKLKRAHWEHDMMIKEAARESIRLTGIAVDAHSKAVDSAVEMILTGATRLPDLYMALFAAVSGNRNATEADRTGAKELLKLIVSGLKGRGVPNHRMGFRKDWDREDFDSLGADAIVELCDKAVNVTAGNDTATKLAVCYITEIISPTTKDADPLQSAKDWLSKRPSMNDKEYTVPNKPEWSENKVVPVNGDSEFIIAVKDLVGARDRMSTMHNAQEYLGLRLKQIEDHLKGVSTAQSEGTSQRERENEEFEAKKKAALPLAGIAAAANVAGAVGSLFGSKKAPEAQVPKATGAKV